MYHFKLGFSFFPDLYPGVGLLDHMVVLCLVSKGTSILLSIAVAPVYFPTSNEGGFPLSIPSQAFMIVYYLVLAVVTGEVIFHCGFNLHNSN